MNAEQQIFNHLISRETKFTVGCIEFQEKLIVGTVAIREKKCRARAKILNKLIQDC